MKKVSEQTGSSCPTLVLSTAILNVFQRNKFITRSLQYSMSSDTMCALVGTFPMRC